MLWTPVNPNTLRRAVWAASQTRPTDGLDLRSTASNHRSHNPVTLQEDEHSYTLSFDVPGVRREQLSVALEDNVVRLRSLEGAARSYQFAIELPQGIDPQQSLANLELGILTLKLAKLQPISRVTELSIH